ncbi:MAG: translation initiation factor IF-2 [Phycisphaerales bacterium]
MAKSKKRLHELAKDLGVESKVVIAKCHAEGLDISNPMATVSIGLEMTIREWFTEGGNHTAVETAEKVDLDKVKTKARRRARVPGAPGESHDESADAGTDTATQTVEAPGESVDAAPPAVVAAPVVVETPVAPPAPDAEVPHKAAPRHKHEQPTEAPTVAAPHAPEPPPPAPVTPPTVPAGAEPVVAPTSAVDAAASAAAEPAKAIQRSRPNVPKRPENIKPGPQLHKPKAAKLKGPRVVRVEAPEVIEAPRPRRPAASASSTASSDMIRSRGPVRGRGVGGPAPEEDVSRSPRRKRGGGGGPPGSGGGANAGAAPPKRTTDADLWRRGTFSEQDLIEREERLSRAGGFLKQRRREMRKHADGTPVQALSPAEVGGKVEIAEPFTIKELSAATGIKAADIIKFLFDKGVMTTLNHAIDKLLAAEVCLEYNIELVVKEAQSAQQRVESELLVREPVLVQRRPPIVAVLGHVDHGKTSLLDRIRTKDVAAHEAGGITQHIGAYRATIKGNDGKEKTVVFLDTPGHEAFTAMRLRGANLTDIVVLVVAADDGVMPQTIESINHAKAAGVPIVVALNKIDRPDATEANVTKILGQLAEQGLNPTEWGGDTEVMRVSATTGQGVTDLVEVLDYQAELKELTADYGGPAYGQVIEAELSEGRGPVARVLVQGGELKIGDFIVIGRAFGRVRDIIDDRGSTLTIAGPATPVEISGIDHVPDAGDKFYVTASLRQAEDIATQRRDAERKRELASKSKVTLDNVFEQMKTGAVKELRIVVKADVQGSVEVLRKTLEQVGSENSQVAVRVLHAAVGGITESDVLLAEASDAIIVGFNVIASQHARAEAEHRGVDIRLYRIIYNILDDVKNALEGMLAPEKREEVIGHAAVREVFRISKVGMIAGCYVTDGLIRRNALIRVTRDNIVTEHDRTLSSLKRFKDDAREVRAGMECGCSIDGYDDIRAGDVLECYTTTEVKQKL